MRSGQVTVFIIIGLVLMLATALVIYYTSKQLPEFEEAILVPKEAKPVHDFITNCLDITAKNALTKLGVQGGYLTIPPIIERTPPSHIPLDPAGTFKTPLWYYEGQDRTPSLEQIQQDLNMHITNELRTCTQNFRTFEQEIKEHGNITITTTITDDAVLVKAHWPLTITQYSGTASINNYAIHAPVKLKKIWQLANSITQAENTGTHLENLTIDWMSSHPDIPLDGLELNCNRRRWRLPEIKTTLQKVLATNLPSIRIEGTSHQPYTASTGTYQELARARERMLRNFDSGQTIDEQKLPQAPEDAYEFFKMRMTTSTNAPDLQAGITYQPEWSMSLSAEPNNGQNLVSNTAKTTGTLLRLLCINQWHFTYDIIYPVKITIRDQQAYNNEGYHFTYGLPVLIDNNAPDRVTFGIQKFQQVPETKEFCTDLGDRLVEIRAKGQTSDFFTSELDKANITYTCFTESCQLGTTTADQGVYRLRTLLPRGCTNPFITATKEGYLPETKPLTNNELTLELQRLTSLNASVVVHPYYIPEKRFLTRTETLGEGKNILVRLNLKNTTYEQGISIPGEQNKLNFLLGKGTYELDATLTSPAGPIGGYHDESITLTAEDLAGARNIEIHVIEFRPHPRNDDERLATTTFLFTNTQIMEDLKPTFT